jgi:peptidoglycan/LPS O-acetylase OafA/YrhL
MSGYREHSYDPNAYERQGPPLRPFNWVQWTGFGLGVLGAAICVYYLLGKSGWVPPIDSPMPGAILPLLGVSLINSRRRRAPDPAPELAAARKRWMLVIVALCTAILGAAVAIQFSQGA